jgi:pyruvate/2-oxoacid:ferredoxin oxidoreductase alpha subunit
MTTLIVSGPVSNVVQWLDAVKPAESEILFKDQMRAQMRAVFSDDAQAANAVAGAIVSGVKVEKMTQSGSGAGLLLAVAAIPAGWLAWKWFTRRKR